MNEIVTVFNNSFKGNFRTISLENNIISSFQNDAFLDLPLLNELAFSNNLIRKLDFRLCFRFNLTKLYKLNFKNNKIETIFPSFFTKFPYLRYLDLSFNNFFLLRRSFLLNLLNLKFLFLNNNQILTIDYDSFGLLPGLEYLDLKNNLIYDLGFRLFLNLNNLRVLNLSTNKIENVLGNSFQGLTNLTVLDLSENKIKIFDKNISNQLLNLEEIFLKSNHITSFNFSFVKLRNLDLSFNNLRELSFISKNVHLSYLDISNNDFYKGSIANLLENLLFLNASNMGEEFLSNLKYSSNSLVQSLDLSYNNLTKIQKSTFSNLKNLKKLYLKEANLNDFDFLLLVNQSLLEELDLSGNREFGKSVHFFNYFRNFKILKLSNTSLFAAKGIDKLFIDLIYLDLSYNSLRSYDLQLVFLEHLDLSFNSIEYLFESNLNEIKYFMQTHPFLKSLYLIKSFTLAYSQVVLYFNKNLERIFLTGNSLDNFPKFCQFCDEGACSKSNIINFDCRLITLNFDSNSLTKIMFEDLMGLNNLEYLNLENNRISFIETNSFSNLINLKTLILSRNQIVFKNKTNYLFDNLSNLKLLNLSYNKIEFISAYFFFQLYKLETLDLSLNRIYQIENYSFYKLSNLKSLYLNENSADILIEKEAFVESESIQNIFISKNALVNEKNGEVRQIFVDLFELKNSRFSKKSLNRSYFKSLFLTSSYLNETYDCNLTLLFIEKNVHFNFKTEKEIFDYFNECSHLTLKNISSFRIDNLDKTTLLFSNFLVYPFYLYLLFVYFISMLLLISKKC